MQFAMVDGRRREPAPRLKGTCPSCGDPLLAKCGSKIAWHWAHCGGLHCDPWWENETPWHRDWKSCFPDAWREIVHFDATGEKHVADVKTDAGTVLEFQNSPMPSEELKAREAFYGKMIWIVNAALFAKDFSTYARLPDPDSEFARNLVFTLPTRNLTSNGIYWVHSPTSDMVELLAMEKIREQIDRTYAGHHFFVWKRPRRVWYEATAPVYLDFGTEELWLLRNYRERDFRCVQRVDKIALVAEHGGTIKPQVE